MTGTQRISKHVLNPWAVVPDHLVPLSCEDYNNPSHGGVCCRLEWCWVVWLKIESPAPVHSFYAEANKSEHRASILTVSHKVSVLVESRIYGAETRTPTFSDCLTALIRWQILRLYWCQPCECISVRVVAKSRDLSFYSGEHHLCDASLLILTIQD